MEDGEPGGDRLRDRITSKGEDALGKLAQDLLENPLVNVRDQPGIRGARIGAPPRRRRPRLARSTSRRRPTSSG